jgi:hypothetical protein
MRKHWGWATRKALVPALIVALAASLGSLLVRSWLLWEQRNQTAAAWATSSRNALAGYEAQVDACGWDGNDIQVLYRLTCLRKVDQRGLIQVPDVGVFFVFWTAEGTRVEGVGRIFEFDGCFAERKKQTYCFGLISRDCNTQVVKLRAPVPQGVKFFAIKVNLNGLYCYRLVAGSGELMTKPVCLPVRGDKGMANWDRYPESDTSR